MAETFTVFIDPRFDAAQRTSMGNAIVNYIVTRTRQGLGVNNQPFISATGGTAYSKAYQAHQDFAGSGKSPSPINLTLSGGMLAAVRVLDVSLAGKIVIGIEDAHNASKAVWMREKGYHFLGLSDIEQSSVLSGFSKLSQAEINRRINNG
jgi:hypothetical protein